MWQSLRHILEEIHLYYKYYFSKPLQINLQPTTVHLIHKTLFFAFALFIFFSLTRLFFFTLILKTIPIQTHIWNINIYLFDHRMVCFNQLHHLFFNNYFLPFLLHTFAFFFITSPTFIQKLESYLKYVIF